MVFICYSLGISTDPLERMETNDWTESCQFALKRSGVQTLTQLFGFTVDVLNAKRGGGELRWTLKLTGIDQKGDEKMVGRLKLNRRWTGVDHQPNKMRRRGEGARDWGMDEGK